MKTKHKRSIQPTTFKIEDIALEPKSTLEQGKYPFHLLKVGQSFFIPDTAIKSVSPLASIASKKTGRTFRCKSREETGKEGVRVYRVRSSREEEVAHAL